MYWTWAGGDEPGEEFAEVFGGYVGALVVEGSAEGDDESAYAVVGVGRDAYLWCLSYSD